MTYTLNFAPNPNLQLGDTGYLPINDNSSVSIGTVSYVGYFACLVETAGIAAGEGVLTAGGIVPSIGTGSASVYVYSPTGVGSLTISAAAEPSSAILQTVSYNLANANQEWARVVLNNLPLLEGQELYLIVQTAVQQETSFYVSAVQYEMDAVAHPYIDGNSAFCTWLGTPGNSSSQQEYQFPAGGYGFMRLSGKPVAVVGRGESFPVKAEYTGVMTLSGSCSGATTVNPNAAFDAFGAWQPSTVDLDPAFSYASWNNAGTLSGQTGYNRIYGLFLPPASMPDSGTATTGTNLWNAAQYMAAGWEFLSVTNGQQQDLADVQVEMLPYVLGATPVPNTYHNPRQILTTIKPTRLNFAPNPSFAVSDADVYGITTTVTFAQTTAVSAETVASTLDNASLAVTVNDNGDGVAMSITDLLVGDTYIVSSWTQGGEGLYDVTVNCSGGSASSAQTGTGYGEGTYGGGYYGGIDPVTEMASGQWYNPVFTFVAQASTVQLYWTAVTGSGVTYPTTFWVDAITIEHGEVTEGYFDGSFGTDYYWETGGTAGLARSYYYQRYESSVGSVETVLTQHTPQGIIANTPSYFVPYTQ
jgi:hypothetical protein